MSDSELLAWEVVASADEFRELRLDPCIVPLLRIARVTNALSLGMLGMLRPIEDQSPAGHRVRWSALFYTGALLHEGLQIAEGLAETLRSLPAYRDGFAAIQADPEVQALRRDFLKRLRNQATFHVDAAVFRSVLGSDTDRSEVVFASGRGKQAGEIYFDLADHLAVEYLIGGPYTSERGWQSLEVLMTGISDLARRFNIAAHSLVPAALAQMGWHLRERPLHLETLG